MSTLPARHGAHPRRPLVTATAYTLAAAVGVLALAAGLVAISPTLVGTVAAAELAAGAVLMSRTTWMLPALFTLMVFAGLVLAVQLISGRRTRVLTVRSLTARVRSRDAATTPPPVPFELRAPDRAVAEATRGLFRPHGS